MIQPPILITSPISVLVLPTFLRDVIDKADRWGDDGKSGRIDPFTEIYDVSPVSLEVQIGLVWCLIFPS